MSRYALYKPQEKEANPWKDNISVLSWHSSMWSTIYCSHWYWQKDNGISQRIWKTKFSCSKFINSVSTTLGSKQLLGLNKLSILCTTKYKNCQHIKKHTNIFNSYPSSMRTSSMWWTYLTCITWLSSNVSTFKRFS